MTEEDTLLGNSGAGAQRVENTKRSTMRDGCSDREEMVVFFRIMMDHVKSLHDRLDESAHDVKDVPTSELRTFVDKERKLFEEWSRERLKEFSDVTTIE